MHVTWLLGLALRPTFGLATEIIVIVMGTMQVTILQPGGRVLTLDSGPGVVRDSLHLTSSGVMWISDGQVRTARLPAHGRRTALAAGRA